MQTESWITFTTKNDVRNITSMSCWLLKNGLVSWAHKIWRRKLYIFFLEVWLLKSSIIWNFYVLWYIISGCLYSLWMINVKNKWKQVPFRNIRNVNTPMQYVKKLFEMKIPKFFESLWKPLTALLPCLIVLECTTYRLKTRMKTHGTSKYVFSYLSRQHIQQSRVFISLHSFLLRLQRNLQFSCHNTTCFWSFPLTCNWFK